MEIYGPSGLRALIRSTLTFCYAQLNGSYVVHELLWPSQRAYGHDGPAVPTGAADKATGTNAAIVEEKDSSMLAAVQGSARVLPHLPPHESELPGRDFHMDEASVSWPRFAQAGGFHISAAPILVSFSIDALMIDIRMTDREWCCCCPRSQSIAAQQSATSLRNRLRPHRYHPTS